MNTKELKKKAISTLLAGSLIFGTGVGLSQKAEAYSLKEPTISLEEYNQYDGVKIFINGRLVEFNDSLGYPYIDAQAGRTMIPLRAVAEAFEATVKYENGVVYVSKQDQSASLSIGSNVINFTNKYNQVSNITIDSKAIIINDRTYIPLRALFECFGMNVRWDETTKTAHIESNGLFENIDFKDYKVIDINSLDTSKVNKIIYDGVEIKRDYLNVLKSSNQYKVVIDNNIAFIFSYQFLMNINYLYGKEKECYNNFLLSPETKGMTRINYLSFNEIDFLNNLCDIHLNELRFGYDTKMSNLGYSFDIKMGVYPDKHIIGINTAKEIAEEIKRQTSDKEEQIYTAAYLINSMADYNTGFGTAYDVFVNNESDCKGYEHAFEFIMNELDIPCVNIRGYLSEGAHMWSNVYVNGEWRVVDPTCYFVLVDINEEKDYNLFAKENMKEDTQLIKLTYKFGK